ncbi:UBC-like protein [Lojkania enalia]|uniref:Ubiquitin-conjugating enzyme E2 2 n=1 Tax=Lojkania enalia TaxID=147567 RepID=A0A9P4KF76_9PLEO|nr:UBC-like protein [Didymosphaeria enalia]
MSSKNIRRLIAERGSLHSAGLPPNYLWLPDDSSDASDLTSLDVLLAGPIGTPYSKGVWRLRLDIPPTYPTNPPTATFVSKMWHPNVDENTGAVCVETLKRDWESKLRLRDILVTISCLLIHPNPASALNEAAGKLASEDWDSFCKRARLMTSIHAAIQPNMAEQVSEAQTRGEEKEQLEEKSTKTGEHFYEKDNIPDNASNSALDDAMPMQAPTADSKILTEDEENTKRRRSTMELDSDSESEWIPGPTRPSKILSASQDNIFGIKGLEKPMQFDTPPSKITSTGSNNEQEHNLNEDSIDSMNSFENASSKQPQPSAFNLPVTQPPPTPLPTEHAPNNKLHPLDREFSWTWEESAVLYDTGTLEDGPTIDEVRKRMAEEEYDARRKWELKMLRKAGFDMRRYNRGDWGPRTGIHRL